MPQKRNNSPRLRRGASSEPPPVMTWENALWFGASLLVSEVPFVGSIPALTIVMWRMHHVQIKIEKEALKKWKKENADAQLQERRQQIAEQAQMIQYQAGQVAQAQQEAANDAMAIEAANDERIPEEVRKAA